MFKLYRITSEYEYAKLKEGILSFKLKNKDFRKTNFNTFDYGNDENSPLAYKKHFFLTKEDAFIFSRMCDNPEKYVSIFYVPEELVARNLGFGSYGENFKPLEVAISSKEMAETFDLKPIVGVNSLEFLDINNSKLVINEERLNKERSTQYYLYNCMLNSILKKFYTSDENIFLVEAKRYLDDENNRKMLVEKVKELFYY